MKELDMVSWALSCLPSSPRLDVWSDRYYHGRMARKWPNTSIRINPVAVRKARIAALTADKALGDWLEEAIEEKLERREESTDVAKKHR